MSRGIAVTFVIMAGGRGERLWPLVRTHTPKVCLSPVGTRSLLQLTIDRLRPVWPRAEWLIVTTSEQADAVRRTVPAALRRAVLVEPQIKNTAACITLAAVALAARDPRRVMVVVPADHWVGDVPAFRRTLREAIRAAVREGTIATIGIRPTGPHTGFGYLCAGALAGRAANVFRLKRFIEKPSRAVAERLLKRPRTFWNAGMFIGTADMFLECVTEWLPEHTRQLVPLAAGLRRRGVPSASLIHRVRRAYRRMPAVSFDHGVMNHLHRGLVVAGHFAWADLGSWDTWARLGKAASRTVEIESERVTVVSQDDHLVAVVGVKHLVVVHTPTATLICRADRAQAVRDVVRRLSADPKLARYL